MIGVGSLDASSDFKDRNYSFAYGIRNEAEAAAVDGDVNVTIHTSRPSPEPFLY